MTTDILALTDREWIAMLEENTGSVEQRAAVIAARATDAQNIARARGNHEQEDRSRT